MRLTFATLHLFFRKMVKYEGRISFRNDKLVLALLIENKINLTYTYDIMFMRC
jgi:hypothetical protein